jgi:hypothetical protein
MLARAAAIWALIMAVESVNGTVRMLLIIPSIGERLGTKVSFFSAIILITIVSALSIEWIRPRGLEGLLAVGTLWALMTLAFEAFIIRPALQRPWESFFAEYDPLQGGLMGFGLAYMVAAPVISYSIVRAFRTFRREHNRI